MTTIITTKSGSKYFICETPDKDVVIHKGFFSAKITEFHKSIQVGSNIDVTCHRYSMLGELDPNEAFLRTTPITNIEVKFDI